MKKTLSLIMFAAAVLAGCQKNLIEVQQEENSGEQVTIAAYLDDASKLSLLTGGKLAWAKGDQIKLGNNKTFTVDSVDAVNPCKAYFTGTAPTAAETYRAFYPTLSYSSTAGRYVLSATQNYGLDDKVSNVNYMYAETTDYNEIHFKNVCGLLAIDLKGEGTVSQIEITADEALSGTLSGMAISKEGVLSYTGVTVSARKYVDLGCGKAATLSKDAARRFYVALPENDYHNLKVVITTENGTMAVAATKTASVKKNNIYHLPEITVDIKPLEFNATIAVAKNEAPSPSQLNFAISVTPTDKNVYYVVDVQSPEYVNSYEDAYEFAKMDIEYYSSYTLSQLVTYGIVFKGDCAEFVPSYNLSQDTDYIAYAYAVDEYFNVSAAVKLPVHTAKGELPTHNAQYSDYLGQWAMGTDVLTVEELENGSTYKVTGISALSNSLCTIPYVTASFEKGNFVLNEQNTGVRVPVGSYGDCDFHLSGIAAGSDFPDYPFSGGNPSMIFYGQFSNNQINVYSSYGSLGISWIILSGSNQGKGNLLTPTTAIPSVLKHPESLPEALFGQWQVADGYTDKNGNDRTGWIWTLSQNGTGVKIGNFDPMFAEAGASQYDAPTFVWDGSAKTLTLAAGTATGYTGIGWYGVTGGYLDDMTLYVDLEKGVISLANDSYIAYSTGCYSWYDAPLVFNKVATAPASAKTVSANVTPKAEMVAREYKGNSQKAIVNSRKAVKDVQATFVR